MSLKRYCPECGMGTGYASIKPVVCGKCGVAFDKAISIPIRATVIEPIIVAVEEEPRETSFDPNDLGKLDFQIRVPPDAVRRKVTVGDVAQTKGSDDRRDIPKNVDKVALLDELVPNRTRKTVGKPRTKNRR